MTTALFIVLILGSAVLFWSNARAAAEVARLRADELCRQAGVQLLDQTVALRQLRPARNHGGMTLRRRFTFEFSPDGVQRQRGSLSLLGLELEGASMPQPATVISGTA